MNTIKESAVANAAFELLLFTKFNDFPKLFSEDFYKLTDFLNKLENALYTDQVISQDVWRNHKMENSHEKH